MKKRSALPRVMINIFTAIMPFLAWLMMFLGPSAILSSEGIQSLRYFTVQSNLLEGFASLAWLVNQVQKKETHHFEVLKFISCQNVFLTFAMVMVFLGPLFGYGAMFAGGNFWLHLVIPIVALAEMIFFVRENISLKEVSLGLVPVVLYGIVYLVNVILNGRGDDVSGWNDFYNFFKWGIPVAVLLFAGICLIVFVSGCILRKIIARKGESHEAAVNTVD